MVGFVKRMIVTQSNNKLNIMKKGILSTGLVLVFGLLVFLVTPSQSFARDYEEHHTEYLDKKNRFLAYGCKPKIAYTCTTDTPDTD